MEQKSNINCANQ